MSTLQQALRDPANFSDAVQDLRFYPGLSESDLAELMQFVSAAKHETELRPGSVTDFMGVATRTDFIKGLGHLGGTREEFPYPSSFHAEAIEWSGLAKAVARADASKDFVAIELGAGWGPWLVAAHHGAKARGFKKIRLLGIEADAGHFEFMHQHFLDNGVNPQEHQLLQGAVAVADGFAHFPVITDPSADWGAKAEFHKPDAKHSAPPKNFTQVQCYSLTGLLRRFDHVSYLHCDIQGHEFEVLSSCLDLLKAKVQTMVIGTHSRLIEGQLLDALPPRGWTLASEKPCKFILPNGKPVLYLDGTQVWLNEK